MQNVIERILNLLAFLLTVQRPVTADEIRMTVAGYDQSSDEAFRRMFERDKDLLRQLGIPLELRPMDAWEVEHGYVVPADEYALADPGLNDEERAALWLAAQVVRIGGQAAGPDALFKLGGAPVGGAVEPLAADLGAESDLLGDVFLAVSERRWVGFDYRTSRRKVAPYGLVHRRGHWYVVGPESADLNVIKAFRLDRAENLTLSDQPDQFVRPKEFRASDAIPQAPWEAGGEDLVAEVLFDADLAWWAQRQLTGRVEAKTDADGTLRASIPVANVEAFLAWMLSFDDRAEILGPPELREALLARVRGEAV
ncbi:MAG: WYL domain-containing protein [bacterium]|nr:WYL domain-containing protein [bacterium]